MSLQYINLLAANGVIGGGGSIPDDWEPSKFVGEYETLLALTDANPEPIAGNYGDVNQGIGSTVVRYVYDSLDEKWVAQLSEDDLTNIIDLLDDKVDTTDPRLSDSRAPTGGAGGVLSGSYPNPGFAVDMATQSELDSGLATKENVLGTGTTSQYLRGDKTWATPPNTTYTEITTTEIDAGTASTLRTITGRRMGYALATKANVSHTHPISDVTNLQTSLDSKVDKVAGKQLSTEDYTSAEKTKLSGIETGAQVNIGTDLGVDAATWGVTITSSTGNDVVFPVVSPLSAGILMSTDKAKLDGIQAGAQVNVGTNLSYNTSTRALNSSTGGSTTLPLVTSSIAGMMPSADKVKLDGIATGATANSTDAQLRDRATHTGTQAISTVSGLQTALDGKAPTVHTHTLSQITDSGNVAGINTNGSTANYLRGDGTWVTPPNTTYSEISEAEINAGTASTGRTITGRRARFMLDKKADTVHTHAISDVTGLQTSLDLTDARLTQLEFEPSVLPTLVAKFSKNKYKIWEQYGLEPKQWFDLFNVTRNSTATYTDPTGKIRTAGVDEPRFTFDPETGEPLGLLIEDQRTNLLIWSENSANRTFTPASQVSVSDGFPAPSGVYANYLVNTEFNGSFAIFQTLGTITAGTPVTLSVFVGNSTNIPNIVFNMGDDFRVNVRLSDNTLQALSAGLTTSNTTLRVKPCLNGRRISVTVTLTSNQTRFGVFFRKSSSSVAYNENWVIGDLVSITGFQLEQASTPSSYIPTEASAVTRLADNVSRTLGAEFDSERGTLYCEIPTQDSQFFDVSLIKFLSGSDALGRGIGFAYHSGGIRAWIGDNSSNRTFVGSPLPISQVRKVAITYTRVGGSGGLMTASAFINGQFMGSVSQNISMVPTQILLSAARSYGGSGVGSRLQSFIDFRYYPRALSQSEAQALTKI